MSNSPGILKRIDGIRNRLEGSLTRAKPAPVIILNTIYALGPRPAHDLET